MLLFVLLPLIFYFVQWVRLSSTKIYRITVICVAYCTLCMRHLRYFVCSSIQHWQHFLNAILLVRILFHKSWAQKRKRIAKHYKLHSSYLFQVQVPPTQPKTWQIFKKQTCYLLTWWIFNLTTRWSTPSNTPVAGSQKSITANLLLHWSFNHYTFHFTVKIEYLPWCKALRAISPTPTIHETKYHQSLV